MLCILKKESIAREEFLQLGFHDPYPHIAIIHVMIIIIKIIKTNGWIKDRVNEDKMVEREKGQFPWQWKIDIARSRT